MDNLKQIGLALLNYEDERKALPPISSNFDPIPDVPGFATGANQGRTGGGAAFRRRLQLDCIHPTGNRRNGFIPQDRHKFFEVYVRGIQR